MDSTTVWKILARSLEIEFNDRDPRGSPKGIALKALNPRSLHARGLTFDHLKRIREHI